MELFKHYTLTIKVRNRICGGVPKKPEAIEGWIKASMSDSSRIDTLISETKEAMKVDQLDAAAIEDLKKSCWNGFKSDENGLYIEGRQIKAAFKEAANVIKNTVDITAFKARIAERLFVKEEKVYLHVLEATDSYEGVVHAMTAQGPISALKRVDFVEAPEITCHLKILNEPMITKGKKRLKIDQYLDLLLEYMSENGLGAERSQGNGKFEVLRIEEEMD